jgi:hypothetical protein
MAGFGPYEEGNNERNLNDRLGGLPTAMIRIPLDVSGYSCNVIRYCNKGFPSMRLSCDGKERACMLA